MRSHELQKLAHEINVLNFLNYCEFLSALYVRARDAEGGYSYSQFAQDLGFSFSNVIWMVVSGKRKLTRLTSTRIAESLKFRGRVRKYFLLLVKQNNTTDSQTRSKILAQLLAEKSTALNLEVDSTTYFSQWYYSIVRELSAVKGFSPTPEGIAKTLYPKLKKSQIHDALEVLQSLGLLIKSDDGTIVPSAQNVTPDSRLGQVVTMRYHESCLELAKDCVSLVPDTHREYNVVTARLAPSDFASIKQKIHNLCREVLELEARTSEEDKCLYQFSSQLFTLHRPYNSGGEGT